MEKNDNDLISLRVAGIYEDSKSAGNYQLVLQEIAGRRAMAVSIGIKEAQAIVTRMECIQLPRPLTHDLMTNIFKSLSVTVSRVIIEDILDGYYIASIVCEQNSMPYVFDARMSDAIALALCCHAPIFAREHVVQDMNEAFQIYRNKKAVASPLESLSTSEIIQKMEAAVAVENYEEAQRLKDILTQRGE